MCFDRLRQQYRGPLASFEFLHGGAGAKIALLGTDILDSGCDIQARTASGASSWSSSLITALGTINFTEHFRKSVD